MLTKGIVGDSYAGEWVNLGAGAITSNLKNAPTVRCRWRSGGQYPGIATGRETPRPALIGDHTKTAIGTRLTTGTYLGYCCMVALSTFAPRFVPSFSFLTDKGAAPYDLDKARHMMTTAFARRRRRWGDADEKMLRFASARQSNFRGDLTPARHDPPTTEGGLSWLAGLNIVEIVSDNGYFLGLDQTAVLSGTHVDSGYMLKRISYFTTKPR